MTATSDLARTIVAMQRRERAGSAYGRVVAVVSNSGQAQAFIVELKSGGTVTCSIAQAIQDRIEATPGSEADPVGREVVVDISLTPPYVSDLVVRRGALYADAG
jgi:hypothetical protein